MSLMVESKQYWQYMYLNMLVHMIYLLGLKHKATFNKITKTCSKMLNSFTNTEKISSTHLEYICKTWKKFLHYI